MTQMPHENSGYEQILLGSMMTDPTVIDAATEAGVTAETFHQTAHATIYRAILAGTDAGTPVEVVALAARLADSGELARVGGAAYLHTCLQAVPTTANAGWYAAQLAELARWRHLGTAKAQIGQLVDTGPVAGRTAAEAADLARQLLDNLDTAPGTDDPVRWADLIPSGLNSVDSRDADGCVPTGITDLDRLLGGGLKPGHQVILAGRTAMGKSVLARNLIRHAAFNCKIPSVLFTMEMSAVEVFRCILSAQTRIPLHAIETGDLSDADWTRAARFVGDTTDAPLFIDDTAGITLSQIKAKCRRLHKRHGLGLIVVDYLQLMTPEGRNENRQVAVAEMSRGLKILAQQLQCPVVTVAQLNRGPEMRADKRPQLADLRESGSVENDANVAILVFREDYYDKESPRAGEADFIVAKHRGGPTDTITVAAQLHLSRFVDMAVA